jgi:hypothetical protein
MYSDEYVERFFSFNRMTTEKVMHFEAIYATVSGISVQLKNMCKSIPETANVTPTISIGKAIPLKGFYIDSNSYADIGTFFHGGEMSICMSVYIDKLSLSTLFF